MLNRTDLALESYEENEKTKLNGVIVREDKSVTTVKIINKEGAEAIGKPIGKYITLKVKSFVNDTDIFDGRLQEFAAVLSSMLPSDLSSVLVIGLGNKKITADALGPKTNSFVLATRHIVEDLKKTGGYSDIIPVSSVATGVLGETGIETCEIIKGITQQIKPSCVIAVDALAATSTDRLGTTVQFSDAGISPGSGVGNHRHEISRATLGVPVVSIGIPTVVSTSVISGNSGDDLYVTPREIDRITNQGAKLIGMGINVCLQKGIEQKDLFTLVG
ncbi:MAG: GPR endopeptidase [Eubacterium sp.]